jgi:phosphopantothenoylcysteine decarboxylase / phosphopantothenate---cysteine ligase
VFICGFSLALDWRLEMRLLLTAGPTREALDPVRYLGNRSSGRMGVAVVEAAVAAGHEVTVVSGPVEVEYPAGVRVVRVESALEMFEAVRREWGGHELLVMAAAVADYRPRRVSEVKMSRSGGVLTLELEPTEDIAAWACGARGPGQRVVGFSLEREGDEGRAVAKLAAKKLDMIVFNPLATMSSAEVSAVLLWADGRREALGLMGKREFARVLVERAEGLFGI